MECRQPGGEGERTSGAAVTASDGGGEGAQVQVVRGTGVPWDREPWPGVLALERSLGLPPGSGPGEFSPWGGCCSLRVGGAQSAG